VQLLQAKHKYESLTHLSFFFNAAFFQQKTICRCFEDSKKGRVL